MQIAEISGRLGAGGSVSYDASAAFPGLTSLTTTLRTTAERLLAPVSRTLTTSAGVTTPPPYPPSPLSLPQTPPVPYGATRAGTAKADYAGRAAAGLPAAMAARITAYSKKRGVWRVAMPTGLAGGIGVAGLDGVCLAGACGLGAPYQETPPSAAQPPGATVVDESTFEKQTGTRPWYKKPLVWAAIAGGAAAIGGGAWFVLR